MSNVISLQSITETQTGAGCVITCFYTVYGYNKPRTATIDQSESSSLIQESRVNKHSKRSITDLQKNIVLLKHATEGWANYINVSSWGQLRWPTQTYIYDRKEDTSCGKA